MSKVFLEKLILFGKHGVSEQERANSQEFILDVSAEVDTEKAASSDNIADTANYKDFLEIAREIIEGPSKHLLETLAEDIAKKILENNKVKNISVSIRKPKAVPLGIAGVTVSMNR